MVEPKRKGTLPKNKTNKTDESERSEKSETIRIAQMPWFIGTAEPNEKPRKATFRKVTWYNRWHIKRL